MIKRARGGGISFVSLQIITTKRNDRDYIYLERTSPLYPSVSSSLQPHIVPPSRVMLWEPQPFLPLAR